MKRQFHIVHISPCPARFPPNRAITISLSSMTVKIIGEYQQDTAGVNVPSGIRTIVTLDASSLDEAIEEARNASMTYLALSCLAAGVPYSPPRPHATLEAIDKVGRYRYRQYFYNVYPISPTQPVPIDAFQTIYERLAGINDDTLRERLALAVRWYTVGLGQIDRVNQFLTYWIALEAIGRHLNTRFHTAGVRALCATCQNQVGKDRDRGHAGMQHILAMASGDASLYQCLNDVRDRMFHGLKSLQELQAAVTGNISYLETAVARGILTLLTPTGETRPTSANAPLGVRDDAQVVWECTLIDLPKNLLTKALYGELFKLEYQVSEAQSDETGAVTVNGHPVLQSVEGLVFADQHLQVVQTPGLDLHLT